MRVLQKTVRLTVCVCVCQLLTACVSDSNCRV